MRARARLKLLWGLSVLVGTGLGCGDAGLASDRVLELSVDLTDPVIAAGDSTIATIRLRNRGVVPITLATGGCLMLPYVAEQSSDEIVYPPGGGWVCVAVLRQLTLAAGEEETQRLVIYAGSTGPAGRAVLAAGSYEIYATLQSAEFPLRAEPVGLIVE